VLRDPATNENRSLIRPGIKESLTAVFRRALRGIAEPRADRLECRAEVEGEVQEKALVEHLVTIGTPG
jgi:hypothetical protein